MTLKELIKRYNLRILTATNKKAETEKIIQEINRLTYSTNNLPISNADKKELLLGLQRELLNESVLIHSKDNKEHLELISQALKLLEGNWEARK